MKNPNHYEPHTVFFDGRDATGKSTLRSIVSRLLTKRGVDVLRQGEFSGYATGTLMRKQIREQRFLSFDGRGTSPEADALILAGDLLLQLKDVVSAKNAGKVAIIDRGPLSFYGYQSARLAATQAESKIICNDESDWLLNLARLLVLPRLTLFLRISDQEMMRRIEARGENPLNANELSYLQTVESIMENNLDLGGQTIFVDAQHDAGITTPLMATLLLQVLSQPTFDLHNTFLTTDEVSVALIKPEFEKLDSTDQASLSNQIRQLTQNTLIGKRTLHLSRSTTGAMWSEDLAKYDWGESYCDFMTTGPVTALVLRGQSSAREMKLTIREQWAPTIQALSTETPFSQDLVHGSDFEDGKLEMDILKLSAQSRLVN
ncbi:MAG TPA: nucleoside-diphosphate kinase [Candidatus Woesebacteria bacterium]|nr:nucleoside-diphosphate kinase [Candidatus Woesebacteria bacterium]